MTPTKKNGQGHTRGPWKWHPRSISAEHNGSVYREPIQGHAYAVAMQPRYVSDEEWAANARLIAAAPDLLEALEVCVAELEAVRDGSIGGIPNDIALLIPERIEQARTALSRVSGEGR